MKLSLHCVVVLVIVFSMAAVSQAQPPADPYKPVLDRLQAITTMPLDSWQIIAADLPHGETPGASMADAKPMALKQSLQLPVWLYSSVEIPPALNGYSVAGSRVSLNLDIGGNTGHPDLGFCERQHGSPRRPGLAGADHLTQNAQPGQKFLIAVRVLPSGTVGCCGGPPETRLDAASLVFDPPENRPDPASLAPGNHGGRTAHRRLSRRQSSSASSNWMRR